MMFNGIEIPGIQARIRTECLMGEHENWTIKLNQTKESYWIKHYMRIKKVEQKMNNKLNNIER